MNDRERDDYAAKKDQELRGHDARMKMVEARAREDEATEQLKELTGLRELYDKAKAYLQGFRQSGDAERDQAKSTYEESHERFRNMLEAITAKVDQIDQVREDRLNAQLDQLDQEIVELDVKMQQEGIDLDIDESEKLNDVHDELEAAKEKRRRIAAAGEESGQEMRSDFRRAVDHLKESLKNAQERVSAHH
jgi:hypothetical protein